MPGKRDLQRINRDVNAGDPFEREDVEDWRPLASLTGKDCDSYASAKWLDCLRAGFSDDDMALVTCWTNREHSEGSYHCVLMVHHEGVVYVLCNIEHWVDTRNVFVQRHGYDFDMVPEFMQAFIRATSQ